MRAVSKNKVTAWTSQRMSSRAQAAPRLGIRCSSMYHMDQADAQAYYHTAPSLTSPNNRGAASRPHHILQISAGWSHSACLTSSGDIHLWFPFSNDYTEGLTPDDRLDGPLSNPSVPEEDKASREVKWGKVGGSIVRQLTPIPERPDIDAGQDQELQELKAKKDDEWDQYLQSRTDRTVEEGQKIVKIASGRDFLVALRANGEVWVCSAKDQELGDWVYVSHPRRNTSTGPAFGVIIHHG